MDETSGWISRNPSTVGVDRNTFAGSDGSDDEADNAVCGLEADAILQNGQLFWKDVMVGYAEMNEVIKQWLDVYSPAKGKALENDKL